MANVGEVIKKYIDLRDRKAELAKQQSEEMTPLSEAMGGIENYLMHVMNTMGVNQLKDANVGTAFKAHYTSVQMADPIAFKTFVFQPVLDGIVNYMRSSGIGLREVDIDHIKTILLTMPMWDMIDFRAGKKGIPEFINTENTPVPGVAVNTVATINIRRA